MPTFDGDNLIITLDSGVTDVDVKADLYSEWKEWQLIGSNIKYPNAFRTIGGDPLTPGINAGAYFFIRNDLGWRIKPPEEDITIYVVGNLAPQDSSLPILIPTTGNFRVLVAGLQPITQSVEAVLTLQQEVSYDGAVAIDTTAGSAGTSYPIGTASEPVSNLVDALIIADRYGFTTLRLKGFIQLSRSFAFWRIDGMAGFAEIDINGQNISGCKFNDCGIQGSVGTLTVRAAAQRCRVGTLLNWWGIIGQGIFETSYISLQESKVGPLGVVDPTVIADCSANSMTATPLVIDCQDVLTYLDARPVYGHFSLRNFSVAMSRACFGILSGEVKLEATCTDGEISVFGVGHLEDISEGSVVSKHIVDAETLNIARKLLQNRAVTDASDGKMKIYNDDDDAVEFLGNVYEDANGTIPYSPTSTKINRRNKLVEQG